MSGLCACGCGQETSLAKQTDRAKGYIKGQPMRFLPNHHMGGQFKAKKAIKAVEDPLTGCWNCVSHTAPHGYPTIMVGKLRTNMSRVVYQGFKGEIPRGYLVCHVCDNPQCINPDHLFLGTQKENMLDMVAKGRQNKHTPWTRKLSDEQVVAILKDTGSYREIARKFSIGRNAVCNIKARISHKHLVIDFDIPVRKNYVKGGTADERTCFRRFAF